MKPCGDDTEIERRDVDAGLGDRSLVALKRALFKGIPHPTLGLFHNRDVQGCLEEGKNADFPQPTCVWEPAQNIFFF